MKKLENFEFIDKAKKIHNNKYDYSKSEYINSRTKICVICPKHGDFFITPNSHLAGCGCKKCSNEEKSEKKKKGLEEFIKEANYIHNNKYDYSKVEYINSQTKVCIICPQHGEFWQTPSIHLRTSGCPKCVQEKKSISKKLTTEDFLIRAKKTHGDKYDYSKVNYTGCFEKIKIICKEHGEFEQAPYMHLLWQGCPKCGNINKNKGREKTTIEFINEAKKIHGNKYDYSEVNYINNHSKIIIICKKHGRFLQTPNRHLHGNGCPHCNQSKLELEIENFLTENNIIFEKWKKFKWLGLQSIDFFLPEYNIGIECQGIQHFFSSKNNKSFYTEEKIKEIQNRDRIKKELCDKNNIKLLYYSNFNISFPYEVITDKNKLLKEIKNV